MRRARLRCLSLHAGGAGAHRTWATCSSSSVGSAPASLAIFLRAVNMVAHGSQGWDRLQRGYGSEGRGPRISAQGRQPAPGSLLRAPGHAHAGLAGWRCHWDVHSTVRPNPGRLDHAAAPSPLPPVSCELLGPDAAWACGRRLTFPSRAPEKRERQALRPLSCGPWDEQCPARCLTGAWGLRRCHFRVSYSTGSTPGVFHGSPAKFQRLCDCLIARRPRLGWAGPWAEPEEVSGPS